MVTATSARARASARKVLQARPRAAVRHEDLLAVAARLFRERGFAATSVRDIAEELGVTSAALYHHVASKDDLLYQIMDHAMTVAERHLDQALRAEADPQQRLRLIVKHQVGSVLDESQPMMAVFFQEIGLARGSSPGLQEIQQRRSRHQERLVAQFREAAQAGLIQTPDPRVTVNGMLGMCNWLHRWYRPNGSMGADQIAEHFADVLLRGIATQREDRGHGQR